MRPLEIVLLTLLLIGLVWLAWLRPRYEWLRWLPLTAVVILLLHALLEGMRWQMTPAYLLTAVLAITALLLWRTPISRPWLTNLLAVLGLLLWGVSLALAVLLPVPQLVAATGSYQVGTTMRYLVDNGRTEIYADDPTDPRELILQIWYPITNTAGAERAVYLPQLERIGPILAEQFSLPPFLLNHVNLAPLDIYSDAPVANGRFPVIIFSHGVTGIRTQNTVMMQELASHGYIVASMDHTYGNAISLLPDGRTILFELNRVFPMGEINYIDGNPLVREWAQDMGFLLDQMALWQDDAADMFNGRLDLSAVGIFGHSTGGGATVEFCAQDGRCRAAIGLDAWVLPVSQNLLSDGLSQPFMFIGTPGWLGPENKERGLEIVGKLQQDGYLLGIENTQHYDFTDLALLSPLTPQLGLSGTINSRYSLSMQNAYIVAFFDQYLKGLPAPLLARDTSPYEQVQFTRYSK